MQLTLEKFPPSPEFNNSAGRLLALFQMLESKESHFDAVVQFYERDTSTADFKARAYLHFMSLVGRVFEEFISDVENSDKISDATRNVIKKGIGGLVHVAYPVAPQNQPRTLQEAEIAFLRMAGSMLELEDKILESDEQKIRDSIEQLRQIVDDSAISKSVRIALLELTRLSRNALDQYTIHGARGFKKAFKKMLAELMEVYLNEGKDVTKQSWWKAAVQHVKLVDATAARLLKYKPLLESTATLFLDGN